MMTEENKSIPTLWFNSKGYGPDELAIELHEFPADLGGRIPASLGLRIRAAGMVIIGGDLIDGGFFLGREQAEELHRQLGEWIAAQVTK